MERKALVKRLHEYVNGWFISRSELAGFMGYKDPHHVDEFLYGLPKIKTRYFIEDVADRLKGAVK